MEGRAHRLLLLMSVLCFRLSTAFTPSDSVAAGSEGVSVENICAACWAVSVPENFHAVNGYGHTVSSDCFAMVAGACQYDPNDVDPAESPRVRGRGLKRSCTPRPKHARAPRSLPSRLSHLRPAPPRRQVAAILKRFSFCIGFTAKTRQEMSLGGVMRLDQWKQRACPAPPAPAARPAGAHDEL